MIRTLTRALCAGAPLAVMLALPAHLDAQDGTSTVRGRITDATTHQGIAQAEIILMTDGRSVRTDADGSYVFGNLPAGTLELLVRANQFPVRRMVVELAPGQVLDGSVTLDSTKQGRATAQTLPAMKVTASRTDYRMRDFERRRQTGRGQYLTDEDIRKSGASNIQDAVREMRGVLLDCGGTLYGGCRIRMAGAPERCMPEYIVDGQVDDDFGPTTPIRDVIGLEVYQGASDVPGEFAGRTAGCGVVVIWTRSRPAERSPGQR